MQSPPATRAPAGPPPGAAKQAVFFNFNEKPATIVKVMDEARRKQAEFAQARSRRQRIMGVLLLAGLPFLCADLVMGYNMCTCSLVTLVLWSAALVGFILLVLNRPARQQFGPQYDIARAIFETLKDDIGPKRTLVGWLDLTGTQQPSKIFRQQTSASGMPSAVYRDEWLRMKMPLYDGNVLRFAAVERAKARLGMWKTGRISGKRKWRAGGLVWARRELRVAITVNRDVYDVRPVQDGQVGKFMVSGTGSDSARVVLAAQTNQSVSAEDMLGLLRFAYAHLKPRTAPAGEEVL